jgi:hypothetical protein
MFVLGLLKLTWFVSILLGWAMPSKDTLKNSR